MLRHYDEIGLFVPASVDASNGYRGYEIAQLRRLHRLLALRDLGFTLEEIRPLLDDEVSVDELHGMLRLRRSDVAQRVADEQARLRRVEAHLRALERTTPMSSLDVAVKTATPIRVAYKTGTAEGFGFEHIHPVFAQIVPVLLDKFGFPLPGTMVAWYGMADDGAVLVNIGIDIGDAEVDGLNVDVLPETLVASVLHHGMFVNVGDTYEALTQWVEDSDVEIAGFSRELYLEPWLRVGGDNAVTEIQFPVAPRGATAHTT